MLGWFTRKKAAAPASPKASSLILNPDPKDYSVFRGYFERVAIEDGVLHVSGWMLSPHGPYEKAILYINGVRRATGKKVMRPDVVEALPRVANAEGCGFEFAVNLSPDETGEMMLLSARGVARQMEPGRMECAFFSDMYDRLPTPPVKLIERVDGTGQAPFYLLKGAQNYWELLSVLQRHISLPEMERILDWGCGPGRLTGFWLHYAQVEHVHGCDIDEEAIAWSRATFPGGRFKTVPLEPPTDYPDDFFDAIISISVLTHLDRNLQKAWLKEMERIVKPGGVVAASLHGLTAAQSALSEASLEKLVEEGVFDAQRDDHLDGVAPRGYYRSTYQTREYAEREWGEFFTIAEYINQGISNFQDLIVLKKRKRTGAAPSPDALARLKR